MTEPRRTDAEARSVERVRRERRGHRSEWFAALMLMTKGYRILARRHRTPLGEIDLIARRGKRLAFVEVKARRTRAECEAAIGARNADRVKRAAQLWLARQPRYHQHEQGFDVVFVMPRRWPVHIENGL